MEMWGCSVMRCGSVFSQDLWFYAFVSRCGIRVRSYIYDLLDDKSGHISEKQHFRCILCCSWLFVNEEHKLLYHIKCLILILCLACSSPYVGRNGMVASTTISVYAGPPHGLANILFGMVFLSLYHQQIPGRYVYAMVSAQIANHPLSFTIGCGSLLLHDPKYLE